MSIPIKKINEFVKGERIEGYFLIKNVTCKTANANGKKYLDFALGDNSGEISAKLWEVNSENETLFKENTVVKLQAMVVAWQSTLQLKIEKVRNINEEDDVRIEDYVQTAPYTSEDMFYEINDYITLISNKDIKVIVKEMFNQNKDSLMYYPAAKKNHHSIRGGLLYHTLTMLKGAKELGNIYEFLNKDLLYAGAILHDLAKIKEMDSNTLGIVNDYTTEGTLLGHITLGIKEIEIVGECLNSDRQAITLLQHMVLSHHYEPEYGSPIKPMIPEAEMLHYLDIMDARMYDMKKAMTETPEGEFSDRIWSLENRRIYNHNFK